MEMKMISGENEEEKIKEIRSVLGTDLPEDEILRALWLAGNSTAEAINVLLDGKNSMTPTVIVKKTVTSTGSRVSTEIKQVISDVSEEDTLNNDLKKAKIQVQEKESSVGLDISIKESVGLDKRVVLVKEEPEEFELNQSQQLIVVKKEEGSSSVDLEKKVRVKEEVVDLGINRCQALIVVKKEEEGSPSIDLDKKKVGVKEEEGSSSINLDQKKVKVKEEVVDLEINRCQALVPINEPKHMLGDDYAIVPIDSKPNAHSTPSDRSNKPYERPKPYDRPSKPVNVKPKKEEEPIDDGDFPEEPHWLLVGRSTVAGLSTCKRKKLDFNEIVYFEFPTNHKTKIVRFSTKRSGEIGRLPIEWTKCIIPLVNSSRVKICGRCVTGSTELRLMQEIHLYISFYIHYSVFTEGDSTSWSLTPPSYMESIVHPLPTLLKLLKIKPFKQAEFTPEELNSHKRKLNLHGDSDVLLPLVSVAKRTKGSQQFSEPNKDEQTISESTLNKLVGAAEVYNLEEMDPPTTLTCLLHPYQKQALNWMSETEEGMDVERAAQILHPCWEVYRITDKRASEVYINIFSGEATTRFPSSTQMARGGILADAMGLGKTVMTIALILARPGRGISDNKGIIEYDPEATYTSRVPGCTLIVCPMALLGQWKDELENHSEPGTLQVHVQYGVDRTTKPTALAEHDVVLTTYGVLSAAYKSYKEESIFHKVDWFRVVLDEAHTIKSSKTLGAQAAFALSSHCRWCLTGTPLQNSLDDLYSLLCFLHVEPWCNWAWWQKLIQRPYENGDERGLRLVKAILRALMLRRTKDTKDKKGSPILVLPPADIQIIECEQSDAERDFYGALFKRSKIQFDQFVAQGKVLHNYASILELLLRLRQCCNHPFLVMSRADSQKYTDLNKLARQFLETNADSCGVKQTVPTRAYVEEVVEGIRRGENSECPICLESADDPVLTPCAHRMCRECLLSSWRTSSGGPCPICRQQLRKNDLITCPSDNPFRIDIDNNWRDSCKVSKLLDFLETIRKSGSGEKSIVFSQWTSFFDLLEIPLGRKGIKFLRFDGKLSQKNREKVLKEFNETNEKMVLLMSLKAGGVGLNLTAASNVFIMDPWWNPAVEEQAIMRIHRIGQKRVVSVRRFIVKETVEERLQQVQGRKQRMIAGALTDEEVRSARIEELKMLFR